MALEDLIRLHTEALAQNTEAVKALTASLAGRTPAKTEPEAKIEKPVKEKAVKETTKAKEESVKEEPVNDDELDAACSLVPYTVVRELVLKLAAAGHREAIKAINAKHGIASLPALLSDKDDFSTVTDPAKLETVYADLLALEV